MGARTGAEYLEGLRAHPAEVWLGNERVADVTGHPALARGALSVAHLYDLQHQFPEEMTYVSPTSGERVGLTHIQPASREDVERRSANQAAPLPLFVGPERPTNDLARTT